MKRGLDSSTPPSASQAAQARAAGYAIWAGYFAGPNILHGWTQDDFHVIQNAGLGTIAYCSGWSDPAQMRAQSLAWDVPICLDVEAGIRADGAWVQGWLTTGKAGLYGGLQCHTGRSAAFHVLADYPGYDPAATWLPGAARPASPCGWQWQGSRPAFGVTVDFGWYDDELVSMLGAGMTPDELDAVIRNALGWAVPGRPPTDADVVVWRNVYLNGGAGHPEWKFNLSLVVAAIQQNPDSIAAQAKLATALKGSSPATPTIPSGTKLTVTVD